MKHIWLVFVTLAALSLGACHSKSGKGSTTAGEDTSVIRVQVPVSDSLAAQMKSFLQTYYALKEAFVKSDTAMADLGAGKLLETARAIDLTELKSDATRYEHAVSAREGLHAEVSGLLGEETMLGKRQEFQMISDITYQLIKTTGMKDQTVYRDYCPMFNDGGGAFWLSDSRPIANPYYGTDMPDCGQLSETITF